MSGLTAGDAFSGTPGQSHTSKCERDRRGTERRHVPVNTRVHSHGLTHRTRLTKIQRCVLKWQRREPFCPKFLTQGSYRHGAGHASQAAKESPGHSPVISWSGGRSSSLDFGGACRLALCIRTLTTVGSVISSYLKGHAGRPPTAVTQPCRKTPAATVIPSGAFYVDIGDDRGPSVP